MNDGRICVSQIQHMSVNDGEGIRTTVFLSGCTLRCKWCSNPETWSPLPVEGRLPDGSTEVFGRFMTASEVVEEIRPSMIFFRASGGGVTWSGGGPFLFPDNLRILVTACAELGISQAAETSCNFEWDQCEDILAMLDFLFVDIKHMDSARHRALTGV
ncbi:MAG TPA: glycyl-radical enzyme activating protein, partial [Synergistaceae bacterium]|nr:glycyl-radical enzyme activating protein [Synergistaceae bacterium]